MKDINFTVLIAGFVISLLAGAAALVFFEDLYFSGMCMIAAAVLYTGSLQNKAS